MPKPKPAHLGPEYAAQFQDAAVVAAYPTRPPYPPETFDYLGSLLVEPGSVLDIGCGTGDIARPLARRVSRVDALDISAPMIAAGRSLPGGDATNLRWRMEPIETATFDGPYGLIVAGESLHWMLWERVAPRLAAALAPGAMLAIVERGEQPAPWTRALLGLITRYSTNKEFHPYDVVDELQQRGFFTLRGQATTNPTPFTQSIGAYIESIHSRNGFSRDRMRREDAAAFDRSVAELLAPHAQHGQIELRVYATVRWRLPHAATAGD